MSEMTDPDTPNVAPTVAAAMGGATVDSTAPPPRAAEPSRVLPVLTALGLLVLLAGLIWVGRQTIELGDRLAVVQHATPAVDPAQVASLQAAVDGMRQQVAALAARPAAAPVDLTPIEQRLSALAQRPVPAPVDLKPIEQGLDALQHRPFVKPSDLSPLEARLSALEHRAPSAPVDLKPIEQRLDALEHRPIVNPSDLSPLEARIKALEDKPPVKPEDPALQAKVQHLAAAQQATAQQADAAAEAARASAAHAARLQALAGADAALRAGRPLGVVPDTPPALARFATVPPPTEAALRLSFPQAAQAAEAASVPSTRDMSFVQRMWQRAQQLVTVREGDRVVVGAPASATLAAARAKLDAGDLAGAVAGLDPLDPAAAKAMAPWREQAQSLLDARAALAAAAAG